MEGGDLEDERRCGDALLLLERERLRGLSEWLFLRTGDLDADRERGDLERDLERERESDVERRDRERDRERDLERDRFDARLFFDS